MEHSLDSIHDNLMDEIKALSTRIEEINAETINKMMNAFAEQKQHIDLIHADLCPVVPP